VIWRSDPLTVSARLILQPPRWQPNERNWQKQSLWGRFCNPPDDNPTKETNRNEVLKWVTLSVCLWRGRFDPLTISARPILQPLRWQPNKRNWQKQSLRGRFYNPPDDNPTKETNINEVLKWATSSVCLWRGRSDPLTISARPILQPPRLQPNERNW
jgi:hypothetical protein